MTMKKLDDNSRALMRVLIERYRSVDWRDSAYMDGYREGIASAIALMSGTHDMPDVDPAGRDVWYAALERACKLDR